MMYIPCVYENMNEATASVKRILAELPHSCSFNVIMSVREEKCNQESCEWDEVETVVLDNLRDLDSIQGTMMLDEADGPPTWDYSEIVKEHKSDDDNIWWVSEGDEASIEAGEGVVVIHDDEAIKDGNLPVIIVKKGFWDRLGQGGVVDILMRKSMKNEDYTSRISPAIYVEICD